MKVELIVLLFACFLTHAQITTTPMSGNEIIEGVSTQGPEDLQTENGGGLNEGGSTQGQEDPQAESGLTEGGTTEEPEDSRSSSEEGKPEDDGGGSGETPPEGEEPGERGLRRSKGRGKDEGDGGGSKEKPSNEDDNISDADYYDDTTAGKPATGSPSGAHSPVPGQPDISHNVFVSFTS
ncbi:hypothetical protein TELCIR_05727 [Teladorsagia circumcincta]|uniref:Uncharacterized protein n=1 Tax=Teladorsagia circumcincta TaxID=45464 RepID=A0A2G9UQ33_TELCI|nr:hypothetical protein TELCIR_05727 [Teladorsagia circumcincta]